jgi:hypothetical protein
MSAHPPASPYPNGQNDDAATTKTTTTTGAATTIIKDAPVT